MWTTLPRPLAALCTGVCLTPLALPGGLDHARAQGPAPPPVAAPTVLEQVIVTAEKRTTDLQKAPLAITSLSAETLRQDNINQIDDLNGYVPGLTVAKNEGAERVVSIRGVGYETAENISTQPGVAFHIDGVNIVSTLALNQDFIDVDHVEVLRGPQSTVFGQTATGGSINVITKQPVLGRYGGEVDASYGNYNYSKDFAALNIPVGDTLAVRGAIQYLHHDGYGEATDTPGGRFDLDSANDLAGKLSLLWKPNAAFSATLTTEHFHEGDHGAEQKDILDPNPNPRQVSQDFGSRFALTTDQDYLSLSYRLPWATLKSLSAYQDLVHDQQSDNDRLASNLTGMFDNIVLWNDRSRAFSQEIDLTSNPGGVVDYIAGVFYQKQHARQYIVEFAGQGEAPVFPIPPANLSIPNDYAAEPSELSYETNSPLEHEALAGFGQATLHVTSRARLTAGARFTHDDTQDAPSNFYNLFGVSPPARVTDNIWTGKLEADYDLAPANMVYASWSRGYKPAGLNFNSAAINTPVQFKPETVQSYEVGSKNRFLQSRLQIDLAAFYYIYRNFQYTDEDPVPNAGGTANIPHADNYGVETEGSYILTPHLRANANLTWLQGYFRGNYDAIDAVNAANARAMVAAEEGASYNPYGPAAEQAVLATAQNTDGERIPKEPEWQGSANLTYTHRLFSGDVTARGEVVYRSSYIYRIFNNSALDKVPQYDIFNIYCAYKPQGGRLVYSVSADNILDRAGVNSRFTNPYGEQTTSQEFIAPRQVFANVQYRF